MCCNEQAADPIGPQLWLVVWYGASHVEVAIAFDDARWAAKLNNKCPGITESGPIGQRNPLYSRRRLVAIFGGLY